MENLYEGCAGKCTRVFHHQMPNIWNNKRQLLLISHPLQPLVPKHLCCQVAAMLHFHVHYEERTFKSQTCSWWCWKESIFWLVRMEWGWAHPKKWYQMEETKLLRKMKIRHFTLANLGEMEREKATRKKRGKEKNLITNRRQRKEKFGIVKDRLCQ